MSEIKSVCVYCGSSAQVAEGFKQAASALGEIFAQAGIRVVFGGGRVGLMGLVSDATMEHGGTVIGIIPEHIAEKEIAHSGLTELHVVETMHERKQMMVDRADAFIILPGGLGTMDEFFEIFTWWQLGLHDKPIIIVNLDGYWDSLLALVDNIITQGFARPADREYLTVINRIDEVLDALERAPQEKIDVKTKWI
ncbi:MAG: TIGR00730 family Rossman fold protein [Rhodospirillales bacterium]|nr:TIGR00730 family Rossman fold protein [Rhodospirillales bacterium]MCB9997059.1 TIGR00730 family Rossman fold protein [Rhodospirillales bacterium]